MRLQDIIKDINLDELRDKWNEVDFDYDRGSDKQKLKELEVCEVVLRERFDRAFKVLRNLGNDDMTLEYLYSIIKNATEPGPINYDTEETMIKSWEDGLYALEGRVNICEYLVKLSRGEFN